MVNLKLGGVLLVAGAASYNSRTASQQPKEAVQMVGFAEQRLIACGLTWSLDLRAPDVSGSWCLG